MNTELHGSEIAIIGMSGRFPKARTLAEFWKNISEGRECISFFTDAELEAAGVPADVLANPNYVKANGILEDIDLFDAPLFGFTPREAQLLDPQHRIFLECAWEALENAGYDPDLSQDAIGLYAGAGESAYMFQNLLSNPAVTDSVGFDQIILGNGAEFLCTKVAYKLNLRGPGISVLTACSTSLVAIHLACQALLGGECVITLAGGVSIPTLTRTGYMYSQGHILSPDGHCRAFDADAQGTVSGAGVGIVVLKRLSDALADRDHVQAIIRGSAVNNDGAVKIGYTAPAIAGQARVIAEALAMAEVEPETIGLIEAHGTATPLGDPIEIDALTRAFRLGTERERFCAIGSVKTNIGHLDAAAGVAGLMKAVLALRHRQIPPSLHFRRPNPKIDFDRSPFFVPTRRMEWKRANLPLRAGVSSFGIGGTNAHVILEEAFSPGHRSEPARPFHLLTVSCRTLKALEASTAGLLEYLRETPDASIADVAYTLHVGRKALPYRRSIVCRTPEDAIAGIETLAPDRLATELCEPGERSVVFLFPGQGTQYPGMTRRLYEVEPVFREHVDFCARFLEKELGFDLRKKLYPEENEPEAAAALERTEVAQPALFTVEYALARLWMSWGVLPKAMAGHSVGELVAACLAGVFSPEDALKLIAIRGRLMQATAPGGMLAVPLSEAEAREIAGNTLCVAAINAPGLTVLSGSAEDVNALERLMERKRVNCRRLNTSRAFHSGLMDPVLDSFRQAVRQVKMNAPAIPFVSNITGDWASEEVTTANYWARHVREAVRFGDAVSRLLKLAKPVFLECGPGQMLSSLVNLRAGAADAKPAFRTLPKIYDNSEECEFIVKQLGRLWLRGVPVSWPQYHAHERLARVPLPSYPFERTTYWIEPSGQSASAGPKALVRQRLEDWFYVQSWKRSGVTAETDVTARPSLWLFFPDRQGIGAACARQMRMLDQTVVEVTAGEEFRRLGEAAYVMHLSNPEHYRLLLASVSEEHGRPGQIAHFRNVSRTMATEDALAEAKRNFLSLLCLAQALSDRGISSEITIVSTGLHSVAGEPVSAEKAMLLGPCHTIPLELPAVRCRAVDVELTSDERVVKQLVCELLGPSKEHIVAWRGPHRWIQVPEKIDPAIHFSQKSRLRQHGVYWITGGLGGIGVEAAEHLVRNYGARLVLTDLFDVPPPERWADCSLDGDLGDKLRRRLARLGEWMSSGADILVARADVADLCAMREVARNAVARFGKIDGIIHAAGMPGIGLIQYKTAEAVEKVFHPKIHGTRVLQELCGELRPEFLLLCSSLNALTSAFGQVDYSAANAFMDGFAVGAPYLPAGTAVLSLNWDTWKEVGMAAEAEVPAELELYKEQGLRHGIRPREGLKVLEAALRFRGPQLIISTRDLQGLRMAMEKPLAEDTNVEVAEESASLKPASARPELSTLFLAPATGLEKEIARVWEDLFGIDAIGLTDNFFELGGHSLLATQLISRLRKTLDIELPFRALFDAPTVAGLAAEILRLREGQSPVLVQQDQA